VASPYHLASAAGLEVLASGGNAVDAAVATNLTLGVVVPYLCGYGGDLFALIWRDGRLFAYNGSGRAPGAATVDAVRNAAGSDTMPTFGPLAVTVPGAVEGWFTLLERFGSRTFPQLAQTALRHARDGFVLSPAGAESIHRSRQRFGWSASWLSVYGEAAAGDVFRQPDLSATIERLASDGPDAYYRGPIGAAIAEQVRALGGLMTPDDLVAHRGGWFEPLSTRFRDVEVFELPPNTQGVTALEAMNIVEALGSLPPDGPDRHHLLLEAAKLAAMDRDAHVSDPAAMRVRPEDLSSAAWGAERAGWIDPDRAGRPALGRPATGGTAFLCASDREGTLVSLIQSNYMGFGSGVTVPGWGINLQNRGAFFSLDPSHVNAIGPGKRTLHTLIPAMAFREERPWLVFGAMGGDGQPQTHLQLLTRLLDDGAGLQEAVDAPRWFVSPGDWSVTVESRFDPIIQEGLARRGHRVAVAGPFDSIMGHANAIMVTADGYVAATDPRTEGAALGL
jgi:gamma-glutamyltranspeptidase / glutathione hydrolase